MDDKRKIPVLASAIAVGLGAGATSGLLTLLNIGPDHFHSMHHTLQMQSALYRLLYGASHLCQLLGGFFLFKMRRSATIFALAALLFSLGDLSVYQAPPPDSFLLWSYFIAFFIEALAVIYIWRVTRRWHQTRQLIPSNA